MDRHVFYECRTDELITVLVHRKSRVRWRTAEKYLHIPNTRKDHGAYGAKPPVWVWLWSAYTLAVMLRTLLLSGAYRQLPVNVWKLEHRLNATKNLPLDFTAEVHVSVCSAWLQPDTPLHYSTLSRLEVAALVQ